MTPAQRHAGRDQTILIHRKSTYLAAKATHPSRWSQAIRNWDWCSQVCLNPDKGDPFTVPIGSITFLIYATSILT